MRVGGEGYVTTRNATGCHRMRRHPRAYTEQQGVAYAAGGASKATKYNLSPWPVVVAASVPQQLLQFLLAQAVCAGPVFETTFTRMTRTQFPCLLAHTLNAYV